MNDLLSKVHAILLDGGYTAGLTSAKGQALVAFEDDAVSGFACVFDSPEELLRRWEEVETGFLSKYAVSLRAAGDKAWNVYSIFLCGRRADLATTRRISWIEEDLNRTRKIAACGTDTREQLVNALLPLLPLQHHPELRPDNLAQRLRVRVQQIAPHAAFALFDESVAPNEVARLLREGQ